jgi:murein L,D-transpeptidase YcbB/YkuD
VRVEDPLRLARYVLAGRAEAATGRVESLIEEGETVTLELKRPLPVHIVYFTAFVQDDGRVGFREDVYGIDQDLIEKLQRRSVIRQRQEKRAA